MSPALRTSIRKIYLALALCCFFFFVLLLRYQFSALQCSTPDVSILEPFPCPLAVDSICPPTVEVAPSFIGSFLGDVIQSSINRDLTVAVPQIDLSVLASHDVQELACTSMGSELSVLLHDASATQRKHGQGNVLRGASSLGDASWVCEQGGERKVTQVMLHVFGKKCRSSGASTSRGLMLDIGANMGYFGMLALKSGCEALLFDLQRGCQQFLNNALVLNGFQGTGRVVPCGVGSTPTFVNIADGTCDGRFPVSARENGDFDPSEGTKTFIGPLTKFIGEEQRVVLMKVDTEGNENHVLRGGIVFFRRNLVENAIVEITPGVEKFWKASGTTIDEVAGTFREIATFGYSLVSLHDWSIWTTPDDIEAYIRSGYLGENNGGKKDKRGEKILGVAGVGSTYFGQGDMWLSLKSVEGDRDQLEKTVAAMKMEESEQMELRAARKAAQA